MTVDPELRRRLETAGYAEPAFAERYDRYRPRPPAALLELLPRLAGVERPALVVDLGSGTGLSTRLWAEHADEVVGVEPSDAMREWAEGHTKAPNIRFLAASAYETTLPDGCADLVTASQSLQWMEPARVLPEIGRILRSGGVFCPYEYVAIQTPAWEPETAFEEVRARSRALLQELDLIRNQHRWPVSRDALEQSGVFRQVRELALYNVEQGDGDRLVGFALSEGSLQMLLAAGVAEEDVGLDRLRSAAAALPEPVPWWIAYRVWTALK